MSQNILKNKRKIYNCTVLRDEYYDYYISDADVSGEYGGTLISDFDRMKPEGGVLFSSASWSGAVSCGVTLYDIGLTAMDNGLIHFRKDRITNEQFIDLLTGSTYDIPSGDTRLFLTPVTGNTQMYRYPMCLSDDGYVAFMGGFYQGFFKLHGFCYQVLPAKWDDDMTLCFTLRPRSDYQVETDTVNYTHPGNAGIFFYIGTRAENKFWPFYKTNVERMSVMRKEDAQNSGYFSGCGESGHIYNVKDNPVVFLENDWLAVEPEPEKPDSYFAVGDTYFAGMGKIEYSDWAGSGTTVLLKGRYPSAEQALNVYDFNPDGICGCPAWGCGGEEQPSGSGWCECEEFFADNYYDGQCPDAENGKAFDEPYIGSGAVINVNGYDDSEGHPMSANGFNEIVTDNKFILFDRTRDGYTVKKWKEGSKIVLQRRQSWPNANYFILMNRTETGYTVDTISSYNEKNQYDYDIHKDIRGNAFALRIRDDGAIGYRYAVVDCSSDGKYSVREEYSLPGIVQPDSWSNIAVHFSQVGGGRMRILFYVGGFLVFISHELPSFEFREIDECREKQEAVPYNISLGGGTIGLMESILPNYYAITDYILPLERDFCGTFMGDIKTFKIFAGPAGYSSIIHYLS